MRWSPRIKITVTHHDKHWAKTVQFHTNLGSLIRSITASHWLVYLKTITNVVCWYIPLQFLNIPRQIMDNAVQKKLLSVFFFITIMGLIYINKITRDHWNRQLHSQKGKTNFVYSWIVLIHSHKTFQSTPCCVGMHL